jgi:hypothetical protein
MNPHPSQFAINPSTVAPPNPSPSEARREPVGISGDDDGRGRPEERAAARIGGEGRRSRRVVLVFSVSGGDETRRDWGEYGGSGGGDGTGRDWGRRRPTDWGRKRGDLAWS